jgi:hypothetical protein
MGLNGTDGVEVEVEGVESGEWSKGGEVRGMEEVQPSERGVGGQLGRFSITVNLSPRTTHFLSSLKRNLRSQPPTTGQRSVSASVQPLFASVKCAARAARQGESNLIGQPRMIGRMPVETFDIGRYQRFS